ncbi:glycosyltransferase, partial [Flavobacteriaceae bacterium]|nr:glycosyltransferase [Flavobacteriaceae bacterium]
ENDLNNRIHFLGVKKDIERYLSPYSIFVSTSLIEGFPNALIEAMNHKMVCIHYHCKGLEDIIIDGENGYLIPIGNQELFKTRIEELINDKELRIKIGDNAYRSIKHLGVENISKQWINLIEN